MKPIMHEGICVGVEGWFAIEPSALIANGPDLRLLRLLPGMHLVIFDADGMHRYGVARVADGPQTAERIPVEMKFDKNALVQVVGSLYAMRVYTPTQFVNADTLRAVGMVGVTGGVQA